MHFDPLPLITFKLHSDSVDSHISHISHLYPISFLTMKLIITLLSLVLILSVTNAALLNPAPVSVHEDMVTPIPDSDFEPQPSSEPSACPTGFVLRASRNICIPTPRRIFSPPGARAFPFGQVPRKGNCIKRGRCIRFFGRRFCRHGRVLGLTQCPDEYPVVFRTKCYKPCAENYFRRRDSCIGRAIILSWDEVILQKVVWDMKS